MRHDRILNGSLWAVLAIGSTGCTHNYYYATPVGSPCAPATLAPATPVASTVVSQYGEVCEVPTRVIGGSTVVAAVPIVSPPVLTGPRPPRIVLSEPGGNRVKTPWRRYDPESTPAITRVEGNLDDDTTVR